MDFNRRLGEPEMKSTMKEVYGSGSGNTWKWQDVHEEDLEVIITEWDVKEFDQEDFKTGEKYKKEKVILTFAGHEKKLICNQTNATAIEKAYGEKFDEWLGKPIILFEGTYGAESKPCVRVRVPKKVASKPKYDERNPPPSDDIPF
jgi:hypothetical protein